MKRIGNLFDKIISDENFDAAEKKAIKGKSKQYGVNLYLRNREENKQQLIESLKRDEYKTSEYTIFTIKDPKERVIYRLPFYPDRLTHHLLMNVLQPLFERHFTANTYACIRGRGVHKASSDLKRMLNSVEETKYCLKLDIRQFYPTVDNNTLKQLLRRKFKDLRLLSVLDEIIDSTPGLAVGSYLSQALGNFYLSYFDHWIKEKLKVKRYVRYVDDFVILAENKEELHTHLEKIKEYLSTNLKLTVKPNYQIFPVADRGIDFLGYKHFHSHTLIRKRIKQHYIKACKRGNKLSIAALRGWLKHADCKNLIKTHEISN